MEEELRGNQDPKVKLSYLGSVINNDGITHCTPCGILVQMYDPFVLADAKWLMPGMCHVVHDAVLFRVCRILDITPDAYLTLLRYIYRDHRFEAIIKTLRTLK